MERKHLIVEIFLAVAVLILAGVAWSQASELERLDDALAKMQARVDAVDGNATPVAPVLVADDAVVKAEVVPVRPGDPNTPRPGSLTRAKRSAATDDEVDFDAKDPAVRGQLREVIQEEQELIRAERRQERQERREQRLRQQVKELADRTRLDGEISEQLTDLLVVEQVEAMEVFSQAREDFDWDGARQKVTSLRSETDEKANDLLDPEEYEEYHKMRQEEANRWNRGPGRNRGNDRNARETRGGDNEDRR